MNPTIRVSVADVRVGDVLTEYWSADSGGWKIFTLGTFTVTGLSGLYLLGEIDPITGANRRLTKAKHRAHGFYMHPRNNLPMPSMDPSLWNNRCLRCGKGIYVGAWKVEHEGGTCPKGV